MATNKPSGDNRRFGAVRKREQTRNPKTGHYTKRDSESGRFMDNKSRPEEPFKGVRKK